MNFQSKLHTNPEIITKMHRPQAIIPYRDSPCISGDHLPNNLQNFNISPLLFTPKIRMKAQSKLSPPNQSSLKKPILPVIQRSKPEDNNISSVNGGPDEFPLHPVGQKSRAEEKNVSLQNRDPDEVKIVRKELRNLSSRKNNGDSPNNRHEGFSFHEGYNNNNKTFNDGLQNINNYTKGNLSMINNKQQKKMLAYAKKTLGTSIEKTRKKFGKPIIDLKIMATPGKKITVLKEYLKSIGNTSMHQNPPNISSLGKSNNNNNINANAKKSSVNNTNKNNNNNNNNKSLEKNKRFLTPNQKPKLYLEESSSRKKSSIPKFHLENTNDDRTSYQADESMKNTDFLNNSKISNKKMSLIEANNASPWGAKKLSMAEISSILNSEELLKIKFKENLHNIWKMSNEASTNDENMSQMKKTGDFSLNLVKNGQSSNSGNTNNEPLSLIRNIRNDSIPNLMDEEDEEFEMKIEKNEEISVEELIGKMGFNQMGEKTKSDVEIISILQKLKKASSPESTKAKPSTTSKPQIFYEEMFDFNKSLDKFSVKPSNKHNLKIETNNTNNALSDFAEKQISPKCENNTKTIKSLYNCYNGSKFASPLMNKKREFDDFLDGNLENCNKNEPLCEENINPIDEFYDDF